MKSLLLADAEYFLSGVSFKCDEFHLSAAYAILSCVVATSNVGLQLLLVLTAFDAFFVAESNCHDVCVRVEQGEVK